MKIKQRGEIPKWSLDVKCDFCHTVFTLEGSKDMYAESRTTGKVDGIYVDYGPKKFFCTCPECGKKIQVSARNIRDDVKAKVKSR